MPSAEGRQPSRRKRAARYLPGAQERRLVETLAGYGVPAEEIRRIVVNPASGKALSAKMLLRHFGDELARGLAKANANVAESLFRLAVGQAKVVVDGEVLQEEREPKVMAAVFWAKTRMGWSEARTAEAHSSQDGLPRGAPILAEAKVTIYIPENNREPDAKAAGRKARKRHAVDEAQKPIDGEQEIGAEGNQENGFEGENES
jgi:hypothetical protein